MKDRLDRDKSCRLRDSIWRSMLELYKKGEHPCLPMELELENNANNEGFTEQSVLFGNIAAYAEGRAAISKAHLKLAMAELDLVSPTRLDKEIAATMRYLGYCTHCYKVDGRVQPRFWALESVKNDDSTRQEWMRLPKAVAPPSRGW